MQLVQDRGCQLCARAAKWMPERDSPAIHVQPIGVDRQLAQAREHLRRERLVQLDQVDLVQRKTRELECLANGGDGANAESFGFDSGSGKADEPRERAKSAFAGEVGR